ncbi:MAG: putative d-4,5-unsaturated alpha-glucuronyl hydrolase [Eubacterium sp.]|nr:putative d-4,5-unsaturated alpha-glucuronyl hydrolase [Eubacterium sp.]
MQLRAFQQDLPDIMVQSVITRHSKYLDKWCYELGLILKAVEAVWLLSGNRQYFNYIKDTIDRFIDSDGNIMGYDPYDLNLDMVNPGKILLLLYVETSDTRYKKAADTLRKQLDRQPRNHQGGFWHKAIYPHQMWLDGVYMSSPFYAQYAMIFNQPEAYEDIFNQVSLLAVNAKEPSTGLLYHAWDESRGMKWSDDTTGCSPHFWGRAMGWYAMALADILDFFPGSNPKRETIINILKDLLSALIQVQDNNTGLWYQVVDLGKFKGNYLEASASCMFTYALSKSIANGYVDEAFKISALKAYEGILCHLTYMDDNGCINLKNVCSVAGLGGNPYRDGSFSYYISEPVVENDYKGYGPFMLAAVEMEKLRRKQLI